MIGYRYAEQVRDMAPVWGLSLVSGAVSWAVMTSMAGPLLGQVVVGFTVFGVLFLGMGLALRCEALTYVTDRVLVFLQARGLLERA